MNPRRAKNLLDLRNITLPRSVDKSLHSGTVGMESIKQIEGLWPGATNRASETAAEDSDPFSGKRDEV